jgi:hypothetical protein
VRAIVTGAVEAELIRGVDLTWSNCNGHLS